MGYTPDTKHLTTPPILAAVLAKAITSTSPSALGGEVLEKWHCSCAKTRLPQFWPIAIFGQNMYQTTELLFESKKRQALYHRKMYPFFQENGWTMLPTEN